MPADTTLDTISEQFAAGSDGCGGNGEGTPLPVSPGGEAGGTPAAAADDNDAPPHRVLIKVGDDYYPGQLSAGYAQLGDWRDTPEFDRLVASAIRDGYFQQKVLGKLVKDPATGCDVYEIEDGRHRFWAAQAAQLHHIEGDRTVMPFAELAVRSLCERLHMSKGARAYLVWPLLSPQVEANKEARKARGMEVLKQVNARKKKGESTETTENGVSVEPTLSELATGAIPEAEAKTLEKLAEEYGIGKTLLNQAKRVHEIFARRKDWKALIEPEILSGDRDMGPWLAGVGGHEATAGKPRRERGAEVIYFESLKLMRTRFTEERWNSLPPETRPLVTNELIETILAVPAEVKERLKLALS